ncbi:MAG: prepilin-type N-terminal cleavage/methylation domain-containing protein [Chthoniobacterales bacterium]|nr:prepilin-type N-terminal cleavage/methylation domain-containing protein [Chthoniobacterales bacterium]MCX7712855.1 prepilin-type N-terminal cleavage/methylation domain-containing protein [Chthoniobacterales bacterium]
MTGPALPYPIPAYFRKEAFTLVELLVALTLLSLLVVSLFSIVDGASKLWTKGESKIEATRESRAALEKLVSELRSAYLPTENPHRFFRKEGEADAARLLFLTYLPVQSQKSGQRGSLCAVGYFLAKGRVSDIGAGSREESWHLYRYLLESNDTYAKLKTNPTSPDLWPTADLSPLSPRAEILARNVRAFRVHPYHVSGASLIPWSSGSNSPPHLLEIELETLNTNTARKFNGDIRQDSPAILQNLERWKIRIPLSPSAS